MIVMSVPFKFKVSANCPEGSTCRGLAIGHCKLSHPFFPSGAPEPEQENPAKKECRYGSKCHGLENKKCPFTHPTETPPAPSIPAKKECRYGSKCHGFKNKSCPFLHPLPAKKECHHGSKCHGFKNKKCPYSHPAESLPTHSETLAVNDDHDTKLEEDDVIAIAIIEDEEQQLYNELALEDHLCFASLNELEHPDIPTCGEFLKAMASHRTSCRNCTEELRCEDIPLNCWDDECEFSHPPQPFSIQR